jgi:hypothetical protein
LAVVCPSKGSPYQLETHSQTARALGWLVEFWLIWESSRELWSEAVARRGLLDFPADVGFTDGVITSIPNPKNTDCRTTNGLTLIFS